MLKTTDLKSGVYLLEIRASKNFTINSPKFLEVIFQKGFYYYAGSAQKNLFHRIKRHVAEKKVINWHIDYLTTHPANKIINIFILENVNKEFECSIVNTLFNHFGLIFPVTGFGNGDCSDCKSHLLYSKSRIDYNHFISRYQSIARLIPPSSFTF